MTWPDEDAARQVQMSLLPPSTLSLGSWEVAGRLVPMGECECLFDYYPLGHGCCALSIAWFGGTAMTAASLMRDVHSLQRIHCNGSWATLESMKRLNEHGLRALGKQEITMFYAEFDSKHRVLYYCSGGYGIPPLLRRRDDLPRWLIKGGGSSMLHSVQNVNFTEVQVSLGAGDSLLLYSHGLARALDPCGMGFEVERLDAICQRCAGAASSEVVAAIFEGVQSFRDHALLDSIEDLPGMIEMMQSPGRLRDVVPSRTEAWSLRKRCARRDDVALVFLGQPSVQE